MNPSTVAACEPPEELAPIPPADDAATVERACEAFVNCTTDAIEWYAWKDVTPVFKNQYRIRMRAALAALQPGR